MSALADLGSPGAASGRSACGGEVAVPTGYGSGPLVPHRCRAAGTRHSFLRLSPYCRQTHSSMVAICRVRGAARARGVQPGFVVSEQVGLLRLKPGRPVDVPIAGGKIACHLALGLAGGDRRAGQCCERGRCDQSCGLGQAPPPVCALRAPHRLTSALSVSPHAGMS
jgi:hypothetical protein